MATQAPRANNMVQAMQQASTALPDTGDESLRDIKGYIAIIIPKWLLILLAVLFVSALGYFIYIKFFRKEKQESLTIFELTIKTLTELDLNKDSKEFYLIYSECIKHYLEGRLGLACLEKTAHEMEGLLIGERRIQTNHAIFLNKILHRADLAKFARQQVSLDAKAQDLATSLDIVKAIEKALVAEETVKEEVEPEFGPEPAMTVKEEAQV